MHIVRLEMAGFKSFADRTVIHFDKGVTGIVGPNGCGKSNVVDALFWVMGEQSAKHLRGHSMEDVIFGGSQKREKGDIAQVTLVVTKDGVVLPPEYDTLHEIQLTRKLYRSGESAYLINNIPCRMRDIQDLFMGTGVGTKAYSIIEQGAIGKMVNAKPEDRRMVIEEAAGITKYKRRRQDSVRKLEVTQQNLLRVNDIVLEKEKYLGSLERQAKKAEKFRVVRDRCRTLDLAVSSKQGSTLEASLQDIDRNLNSKQQNEAEWVLSFETLSVELEQRRLQVQSLESMAQESQNELLQLTSREGRNEKELALVAQNIESLQKEKLRLEKEMEHFESRAGDLAEDQSSLESNAEELKSSYEAAQSLVQSRMDDCETLRTQLSNTESQIRSEIQNKIKRVEKFSRNNSILEQNQINAVDLNGRLTDLSARDSQLHEQLGQLKKEETELRARLEESAKLVKEKSENLTETLQKLDGIQEALIQKRDQAKALDKHYTQLNTQFESLKNICDSLEGYDEGVRFIMSQERSSTDRPVLLSQVLKVPPEYQAAVETLLGPRLQSMVVPDIEFARGLSRELKQAKAGRGNFIPTQLRATAQGMTEEPADPQSFHGRLSQLVEADENYRSVKDTLFGNVLIARSLEQAVTYWQNHPECTSLIMTPEGDVLEPSGALLSGEVTATTSGLLARREQLDQIQKQIEEVGAKLALVEPAIENLENDLLLQTAEKERSQEEFHELKMKLTHGQKDVEAVLGRSQLLQKERDRYVSEMDSIKRQLVSLDKQNEELQAQNEEIVETQKGEADQLVDLETEVQKLKVKLTEKEQILSESRVQLAQVEEKWKNAQERLEEKSEEMKDLESQKEFNLEQLERIDDQMSEGQLRRLELQKELEESSQKKEEMKRKSEDLRGQTTQFFEDVRSQERQCDDLRRQLDSIRQEIMELRLKREQENNLFQRLVDHLLERYAVEYKSLDAISAWKDLTELYPDLAEADDVTRLTELDDLRKKLASMGDVNVTAVEEFETVKNEHAFLVEQKTDLEKALAQLQETIQEMDKNSEDLFVQMFHLINAKFKEYYPLLFGGGMAELQLTNPENMLETGVDIIAQPPGKKLQNVTLLSGGEKALTAVSLIFSIFAVKPAPFCLLDEVDAPLDDANVGRFNTMIRRMSDTSQFIVITHNKRTMEMVDVLYGVTMQEAGVSNMSSIRLV